MPSLAELRRQVKEKQGKEAKEVIKPVIVETIPIRPKPIVHKEALTKTEVRAYIREILKEEQIGKIEKEQKIEIDPTKVFDKLRSLNPEEYPYYNVIIRRIQTGRRSYLDSFVSFINRYFDELKR